MQLASNPLRQCAAPNEAPVETTLLELVAAVAESAESDREVVATIASLLDSGRVTLIGSFLGSDLKIDLT